MQTKTTRRCHCITPRMAMTKKVGSDKCWCRYGEIEALIHCWYEGKVVWLLWKLIGQSVKKVKQGSHIPSICRYMPKKSENVFPHKNLHMNVQSCIIHNSQKVETTHHLMNG